MTKRHHPIRAWACLLWLLPALLVSVLGSGAAHAQNVNQRYNYDRLANGALPGWTAIGSSAMTVQPIDDGDTGRKGFGSAHVGDTALDTAAGTTGTFEATYSFILHTSSGNGATVPVIEWCANAANTTYYSLTPLFLNGSTWQAVFITNTAGSVAITDLFTLPSQAWANGDEVNVHVLFDAAGLHYKVWERNALEPSSWTREVGNTTLGTRLANGYVALSASVGAAGGSALALDWHLWFYPTQFYSSEDNATLSGGQALKIVYPLGYNASVGCPLILYFHGAGGTVSQLDTTPSLFGPYCAAGYAVAMCQAHDDNWGNPASQADYVAAYNYCAAHMTITKLIFGGGSMGSLDLLQALVKPGIPTPAYVFDGYPVVNTQAAFDDVGGFFQGAAGTPLGIKGAFNLTGTGNNTYAIQVAGNDPSQFAPSQYPETSYLLFRLPGDNLVIPAHNTDVLRSLLADKKSVKVIDFPGTHGDPATNASQIVVDEMARAAQAAPAPSGPAAIMATLAAQATQTFTIPSGTKGLKTGQQFTVSYQGVRYTITVGVSQTVPQSIYNALHNGGYL